MAEALCGPSNALQNFQKHTSVDRTLQQDRSVIARRNEQGFRTINPINRAVDTEFHAFQASQLPSVPLQRAQLPLAHITRYPTPSLQQLPEWASDFQNLNLNGSQSSMPAAAPRQAPIPHMAGTWQAEFTTQRSSAQQPVRAQQQTLDHWQPMYQGLGPYMENTMYAAPMHQALPEQINQGQPQFDDAAFAQAFDQAKAEIEQSSDEKGKSETLQSGEFSMAFACTDPGDVMGEYDFDAAQLGFAEETAKPKTEIDEYTSEQFIDRDLSNTIPDQPRIGADTISAKAEPEAINPQIEADELSRTAGHLLDTLKDEKNTKFQQSSFLALMRQLRDKEVKVEGDKMVNVSILYPPQANHG